MSDPPASFAVFIAVAIAEEAEETGRDGIVVQNYIFPLNLYVNRISLLNINILHNHVFVGVCACRAPVPWQPHPKFSLFVVPARGHGVLYKILITS
jgi:hypothetical protein